MSVAALLGVTASGKSETALRLARRRGDIEIVSVDSMCVYRGLDIGTSKPSRAQQGEVPHHLLDLVEPDEEFTVRQFQEAARRALDDIAARGHHALLVGGTGLYLRAVVDDLRFPGLYPAVRAALESELGEGRAEVPELHARLAVLDPLAAARMEPSNQRRVVRALEVTLGSGRPFSTFGPGLEAYPPSPVTMVGLAVPTEEVDRRIAERFDRWLEEGLLEEVRALAASRTTPANERRIIRALEVTVGSGRPFSSFGPGLSTYPPSRHALVGVPFLPDVVDRRIAERFEGWLAAGLLDEVRGLAARPEGLSRTARQALGYRELLAHVEEGAPLDACITEAVRRTRAFARRQTSWFRRDPRITWTEPGESPTDLLDASLAAHASRS